MIRNPDRLTAHTFDVLIIGGGIYGLTMAYDAAARGLSVALVERDDLGSGSSFNHLRTIHGGLRHLQTLDIAHARESVRERRTLAWIAPHMVRPLAFVLPLSRSLSSGPLAMRAGFALDRLVSRDRNEGVPSTHVLPPGQVLSRRQAADRFPALSSKVLAGAARWYDYVVVEADRLTFAWAEAAVTHGATLVNHVEATGLLIDRGRVVGARLTDRQTGRSLESASRVVVNATGGAVNHLVQAAGASLATPLLLAMNVVTRRAAPDEALGGRSPDGRNFFLVPWRGRTLFGTWESSWKATRGDESGSEADLISFIRQINAAFPWIDLRRDEVSLVHRGVVPAVEGPHGTVGMRRHELIRDHAAEGLPGLLTVAGTKYTTARAVAERVVDQLVARLGFPGRPCQTATLPLPGSSSEPAANESERAQRALGGSLPADTARHLVAAYGTRWEELAALSATHHDGRSRLTPDSPVIGAQLVRAVRDEMAVTLCDAVIRRTPLGAVGYPGDAAAQRAADIVGAELNWDESRKASELEALAQFYGLGQLGAST